jgi:hypothetical protein
MTTLRKLLLFEELLEDVFYVQTVFQSPHMTHLFASPPGRFVYLIGPSQLANDQYGRVVLFLHPKVLLCGSDKLHPIAVCKLLFLCV